MGVFPRELLLRPQEGPLGGVCVGVVALLGHRRSQLVVDLFVVFIGEREGGGGERMRVGVREEGVGVKVRG